MKDKKIAVFSTDTTALTEWIDRIQQHVNQRFTTNRDKVDFILDHLDDRPRMDVKLRVRLDRATPDEVLDILKEVYGSKETLGQLQQAFYCRNQLKSESVEDYSYALMEIMVNIQEKDSKLFSDSDTLLKQQFASGVSNSNLSRELCRLNEERPRLKFWELRESACKWMMVDSRNKPRSSECNETCVNDNLIEEYRMLKEHGEQLARLSEDVAELKLQQMDSDSD